MLDLKSTVVAYQCSNTVYRVKPKAVFTFNLTISLFNRQVAILGLFVYYSNYREQPCVSQWLRWLSIILIAYAAGHHAFHTFYILIVCVLKSLLQVLCCRRTLAFGRYKSQYSFSITFLTGLHFHLLSLVIAMTSGFDKGDWFNFSLIVSCQNLIDFCLIYYFCLGSIASVYILSLNSLSHYFSKFLKACKSKWLPLAY